MFSWVASLFLVGVSPGVRRRGSRAAWEGSLPVRGWGSYRPRARAQDAADGQHLLLAARQLGGLAALAFLQVREKLVNLFDGQAAVAHLGRQQQIFFDVEAGEDAAFLGAPGDPAAGDLVRRQ